MYLDFYYIGIIYYISIIITLEKYYPWLSEISSDITIETDDKIICLEFCYTMKSVPLAIADYILNKELDSIGVVGLKALIKLCIFYILISTYFIIALVLKIICFL